MSDKQDDKHRVTNSGFKGVCGVKMMSEVIQPPPRREKQTTSEDEGGVEVQKDVQ